MQIEKLLDNSKETLVMSLEDYNYLYSNSADKE